MATVDELNSVIRRSNCRFNYAPKHKREIVSFLDEDEVPKSISKVKVIFLPEGPKSGNHVCVLITSRRVIALATAGGGAIYAKLYFRPIKLTEITVVSDMNGNAFDFELVDKFVCTVRGSEKYVGRLRNALKTALGPDYHQDQGVLA